MKIKKSFVTNSSSTSFILTTNTECILRSNKMDEIIKNFKDEFPIFDTIRSTSYSLYAILSYPIDGERIITDPEEIKNFCYNNRNLEYEAVKVELELGCGQSGEDEHDVIYVSLKLDNPRPNTKKDISNKLITMMILKNIKRMAGCRLKVRCFYHQYISETWGDGWNGGDPMGLYSEVYEAKKNETFIKNYYI